LEVDRKVNKDLTSCHTKLACQPVKLYAHDSSLWIIPPEAMKKCFQCSASTMKISQI